MSIFVVQYSIWSSQKDSNAQHTVFRRILEGFDRQMGPHNESAIDRHENTQLINHYAASDNIASRYFGPQPSNKVKSRKSTRGALMVFIVFFLSKQPRREPPWNIAVETIIRFGDESVKDEFAPCPCPEHNTVFGVLECD
ncbi:hypothetical protein QAD02_003545 [Eretmocerus hayati]|uniref:Uncharacterized protein n=1 Tax=Eretmocerus hayati TaxID=131215 RepID=A0ACC2NN02_9HYME|nr:hypothetical protein QAD02_003545 [Eretmocerus hayati]